MGKGKPGNNMKPGRDLKAPPVAISKAEKYKEGLSWSAEVKRQQACTNIDGQIIAEVFFATNQFELQTPDDIIALDSLVKNMNNLLHDKFKISLLCTGGADYRDTFDYNLRLGTRRAKSVKDYIDSKITHPNFRVDICSVGEEKSLQPIKGKKPSLKDIMKDRKVVVSIKDKGVFPPVSLAVSGNWIHGSDIERNEIINGGMVVSLPDSFEWNECRDESKYNKREFDPYLPTVIVKTNYYVNRVNKAFEAFVDCAVVHFITNRVLFTASAHTDVTKPIRERYHYNPKYRRVMRKIYEGQPVPEDHEIEEIILKDWMVHARAEYLFEPVYAQLKGYYPTITKRAEALLSSQ